MQTIPQYVCGVIPPYVLSRIRNTSDPSTSDDARATLEQMRELAHERALTLIDQATPRRRQQPYKQRNIYDARGGRVLPGKLVLSDHKPAGGDVEAREAFEALGVTADVFHHVYGRNSIDGYGLPLNATVHYGTRFQNAMWNGEQMVFGDGDGHIFNRFTASVDVVAHELVHGIIQCTTSIGYAGEAGAVNESLADVFGSIVKQYHLGQTAQQADWLIGAELLGPAVAGRGIRSLAAPGKAYNDPSLGRDPQPSHLRDYVDTDEDHGGVHINSGIPNHAFYRVAMAIGGPSWEVAGRIWYRTMIDGLPNEPTFRDLAVGTVDKAGELYGYGSSFQRTVAEAWAEVGLIVPLDDSLGIGRAHPAIEPFPPTTWRPRPRR